MFGKLHLKDTSLISVTGLVEIMRQSYIAAGSTRDPYSFILLQQFYICCLLF